MWHPSAYPVWNPEKELKGFIDTLITNSHNPVESGEGIERLLFDSVQTGSYNHNVESGEGIESYSGPRVHLLAQGREDFLVESGEGIESSPELLLLTSKR